MGHEFEATSGRVIGAAIEVHRTRGPGYLESTYPKALRVALDHRGISYLTEPLVSVSFEGEEVGRGRLDFVVEQQLVVELKAVAALHPIHFAQLRSYLKATELHSGLLLNLNAPKLEIRRMVEG